jgi:hypothetical protein
MRKTGQSSKVLEMRSFYKVWVTSVFAKKRFFMGFSTLIVKHHRGFRSKTFSAILFPSWYRISSREKRCLPGGKNA